MAIRLVHKGPSYGFTVTTPVIQSGQTEREAVDYVRAVVIPKSFPDVEEIHEVDESEIPIDHTCNVLCEFMPVFEWRDNGVRVNMAGASAIHMDKIREVRNQELVKKDIEFMKALEVDDGSHKTVAAEKQTLRDIPQTFDLTTDTVEELKQKWPDGLPKE